MADEVQLALFAVALAVSSIFSKIIPHETNPLFRLVPIDAGNAAYLGGDPGYAALLGRTFSYGWYKHLFTLPFAISGINEIAGRVERIDFLSAFPPHVFHWPENFTGKLHFIKFHRPFIAPFQYLFRAGCALVLFLVPFLNAILYWRKGIRPRSGSTPASASKDILYVLQALQRRLVR